MSTEHLTKRELDELVDYMDRVILRGPLPSDKLLRGLRKLRPHWESWVQSTQRVQDLERENASLVEERDQLVDQLVVARKAASNYRDEVQYCDMGRQGQDVDDDLLPWEKPTEKKETVARGSRGWPRPPPKAETSPEGIDPG